jgi:PAS domain S-box-containing protein
MTRIGSQQRLWRPWDITERATVMAEDSADISEKAHQYLEERIAADQRAMARLLDVGHLCVRADSRFEDCLAGILDAAIALTGADKGNVQLLDVASGSLVIAAQRGFDEAFLRFFANVRPGEAAACGAALETAKRIVVEDVRRSEVFAGHPALDVLIEAGVRAVYSTPLISSTGDILGMLSTHFGMPHRPGEGELQLTDLLARQAADYLERKRAEEALRSLATELRQTTHTLATGLTHCSRGLRYVWANPAYAELAGVPIEQIIGRPIVEVMGEDAFEMVRPHIDRVLKGERVEYEAELPWSAHSPSWIHVVYAPYEEDDASISGWVASVTDISERKRAEQRQQLLIRELNHRVKNTLATVQSIAMHTLAGSSGIDGRETFEARLIALSRTHDLLARTGWEGASLRELLLQELDPFRSADDAPFTVEGPDFEISPNTALALGLAFHEMATNAAKHGALSTVRGKVCVTWDILGPLEQGALRLEWRESGGPPVKKPDRGGFGVTVIQRGLSLELDGRVELDFAPTGLVGRIEIPLRNAEPRRVG